MLTQGEEGSMIILHNVVYSAVKLYWMKHLCFSYLASPAAYHNDMQNSSIVLQNHSLQN